MNTTVLKNHHPLVDLLSTSKNGADTVRIVPDNAKSHAPMVAPVVVAPVGICRWQSSPILSNAKAAKQLFPPTTSSLKRSSSVPTSFMIPSLTSLVTPGTARMRQSLALGQQQQRPSASQLLSEYLRLSTQEISLDDMDDSDNQDDEDEIIMFPTTTMEQTLSLATRLSFGGAAPPPPKETSPSLTSNVKKPVRRKSLDISSTTTTTSSSSTTAC